MSTYVYSGPPSGATLEDGQEILLYPGKELTLPENSEYVQALVARRLLTPTTHNPKAKPATKKEPPKA